MKTLIRIEHSSGKGLWRASDEEGCLIVDSLTFYEEILDKHSVFPTPYEEDIEMDNEHYCAFKSIYQLNKWVKKEWIKELYSNDYKIYTILVSECLEGNFQAVYKKKDIISKTDITELFL